MDQQFDLDTEYNNPTDQPTESPAPTPQLRESYPQFSDTQVSLQGMLKASIPDVEQNPGGNGQIPQRTTCIQV